MYILAELIEGLAVLISIAINILYFLLVLRVITSWVGADPYNEVVRIIYSVTDPILAPFKVLPLQIGMLDFSPILAFLLLFLARDFILSLLYRLAAHVRAGA